MKALVLVLALLAATTSRADAWDGCTPKAGDLRFAAADGTKLVAHRYGRGPRAVVLVHQSDGTMCQWSTYARRLARLGYAAYTIDLRGFGDSQVRHYPANRRYGGDVAAAVRFVRRSGARKVLLVGASLGGSAVISGAANARPTVDGVVSVSGAADLADAERLVAQVRAPSLFVAGERDADFAGDARRLDAASGAREKKLVVVPGAYEHGTQLVAASAGARSEIERFLASHSR